MANRKQFSRTVVRSNCGCCNLLVHQLCRSRFQAEEPGALPQGAQKRRRRSRCVPRISTLLVLLADARAHRADCTLRPAQAHTWRRRTHSATSEPRFRCGAAWRWDTACYPPL